jgi:protein gp37
MLNVLPPATESGGGFLSVEDRKYGLPRIDILRETPAAVRFLSVEPLLEELGTIDLRGIHWVVVGGESNGRACELGWIRSVVQQSREQGVPVFVKQTGTKPRDRGGLYKITSRKGGAIEDLPLDLRIREFPRRAA